MFKAKSMRPVCGALVYSAEKHIALLNSSKPLDVEDMTHTAYSANIITRSQVPVPIHNCLANITSRIYAELMDPITKIISEEVQKHEHCLSDMDNEKLAIKGDSNYADLTINTFNKLFSPQATASVKVQEAPAQEDNQVKKDEANCGPSSIDVIWNFFCSLVESITSLFRSSKPAAPKQSKNINLASASLEHTQQTFISHQQFASAAIVEVVSFSVIKMFYGKVNLDWSAFMEQVVKFINGIFHATH